MENFFDLYEEYTANTEVPPLFHKMCAVCGVAASLGKSFFFSRGHFSVFPNLYTLLIGAPGTGKGTSMGILQSLMLESGYTTFAADKSSKEKFLLDLQEGFSFDSNAMEGDPRKVFNLDSFLSDARVDAPAEVFILAEELNDFLGTTNYDFISLLTKLWSYTGVYRNRLKNSKSVSILEPCVNLLGGNTSAGFALAFPPEIVGQGFLARLILVYGEPTGKKISFPTKPDPKLKATLSEMLSRIRHEINGEAQIDDLAKNLLDRINQTWAGIADARFQHYSARRFNQLIKLCLIYAASRFSTTITSADVRNANTLLTAIEGLMPKALGEFGKSKNSDVASKIMEVLYMANKPISTQELWKLSSSDLNSISELATLLTNLSHAEKIQSVGKLGWLPKQMVRKQEPDFVNPVIQEKLR